MTDARFQTRSQPIAFRHHYLDPVDAAWQGGSAAFGSEDELSDIDALAVVADDAVDAVFGHVGCVRDLTDLAVKHAAARAWFARCIERLRQHGPGSGLPTE